MCNRIEAINNEEYNLIEDIFSDDAREYLDGVDWYNTSLGIPRKGICGVVPSCRHCSTDGDNIDCSIGYIDIDAIENDTSHNIVSKPKLRIAATKTGEISLQSINCVTCHTLIIDESVKVIKFSAFKDCTMKELIIENENVEIYPYDFNSPLLGVVIPEVLGGAKLRLNLIHGQGNSKYFRKIKVNLMPKI